MDRAGILSLAEKLDTPTGNFEHCLKTGETSAVGSTREFKLYAPGIGLVQEGGLKLKKYSHGNPWPVPVMAKQHLGCEPSP